MFPILNATNYNTTSDLSQLLVYANDITQGLFMPSIVAGFFLVLFIGSALLQFRFTGRVRIETSFAAAAFSTFGLSVLLAGTTGLLNPIYVLISFAVAVIGAIWLYFTDD